MLCMSRLVFFDGVQGVDGLDLSSKRGSECARLEFCGVGGREWLGEVDGGYVRDIPAWPTDGTPAQCGEDSFLSEEIL